MLFIKYLDNSKWNNCWFMFWFIIVNILIVDFSYNVYFSQIIDHPDFYDTITEWILKLPEPATDEEQLLELKLKYEKLKLEELDSKLEKLKQFNKTNINSKLLYFGLFVIIIDAIFRG